MTTATKSAPTTPTAVRLLPIVERTTRALGRLHDADPPPESSMELLRRYGRSITWQADLDPLAFR